MLDPTETHRMANLLIREFQDEAPRQAIGEMYRSMSRGDWDAERAWRRVLIAIDALQGAPAAAPPRPPATRPAPRVVS